MSYNSRYLDDKVSQWSCRWSESNSPYSVYINHNIIIHEPINSLTSFCMMIYLLWDIIKLNPYKLSRPLSNLLRIGMICNLWTSVIAHATYNFYYVLLDEYSIVLMIIFYITYKKSDIPRYLIIVFLFSDNVGYILSTCECIILFSDDMKKHPIEKQYKCTRAIWFALVYFGFWILDQYFSSCWYFYGHALFHIGFTYNILTIINTLYM